MGVLGHVAYRDQKGLLHYSAMTFIFDPSTFKVKNFKIIARRKDFPQGETKSEETRDVVFPGGLFKENNKIYLYTGLNDAQIGRIEVENPWN